MTTNVLNSSFETLKEEDISNNAWDHYNEIKNLNPEIKVDYKKINIEEDEEFDENTLNDSAWYKFCEIKTDVNKKPEYKRISKNEDIEEEEIDGAWKEFIEFKENNVKKVEYIKVSEESNDEKEETNEEEYGQSAWNNFKSIESEEKIKRQTMKYEKKKKPEVVKMKLADCAWNEFVVSDKNLFDKYEKSLERLEDDVIIIDEAFDESVEKFVKSNSSEYNEGETTIISESAKNVIKTDEIIKEEIKPIEEIKEEIMEEVEEVKPIEEIKEEVKSVEEIKEEIKPIEEIKEEVKPIEEIKEEVKPVEDIKEVKEEVKPVEDIKEVKEEIKPVEDVKEVKDEVKLKEKISKKKGKFSKLLKKTKKIFKKLFSNKRKEKTQNKEK